MKKNLFAAAGAMLLLAAWSMTACGGSADVADTSADTAGTAADTVITEAIKIRSDLAFKVFVLFLAFAELFDMSYHDIHFFFNRWVG